MGVRLREGYTKGVENARFWNRTGYIYNGIDWSNTKPLWGTGKKVITEIGFYLLRGLIVMYEIVVYVSAVVNKHGYLLADVYWD